MNIFKKSNPVYKVFLIINLLMLIISFIMCILCFSIPRLGFSWYIQFLLYIFAIIAGFLYAFNSYRKNAAQYYKGFMFMYCLESLVLVFNELLTTKLNTIGDSISIVFEVIICAILCVLAFAKNLGEKISYILAYLIITIAFINSIRLIIVYFGESTVVFRSIVDIALAGITCLFVVGKYLDKEARGTK